MSPMLEPMTVDPPPQLRTVLRQQWAEPAYFHRLLELRRSPGLDGWLFAQVDLIGAEVSADSGLDQVVVDG